jgi:hypothetical protein
MPFGVEDVAKEEEDPGSKIVVDIGIEIEKSSEHDTQFALHDMVASNKTELKLSILASEATPLVWIYARRVRCLESLVGGACAVLLRFCVSCIGWASWSD